MKEVVCGAEKPVQGYCSQTLLPPIPLDQLPTNMYFVHVTKESKGEI